VTIKVPLVREHLNVVPLICAMSKNQVMMKPHHLMLAMEEDLKK
jgi:hypothetical protein